MTHAWTTPADIEVQVRRLWDQGRILSARFADAPLFPLRLRFRPPDSGDLSDDFNAARGWIRALEEANREKTGGGYDIVWREVNHRQLGRNRIPGGIVIPTEADALRLIGRQRDGHRFSRLVTATLAEFPVLQNWLSRKPLAALDHADEWDRVLAVLRWFRDHARPGIYLRQLDIAGVDTKFIETRRVLLSELLSIVLPPEEIDATAVGAKGFEQRFGLLAKPPLVRFRILDPDLYVAGLSDITVPAAQLARTPLPVHRVFITENEINGLTFPDIPGSMVIFGLGYSLDLLHEFKWLHEQEVVYWGDIDTHGFAILDRLRATFPHARSVLMDRDTLLAHRSLWVKEDQPCIASLDRLTETERALFADLRDNRLGERVRLEQERVAFAHVMREVQDFTVA